MPHAVRRVACGTGQQGCTFAVLEDGSLFTFGNDAGGRLGHPRPFGPCHIPRKVEALTGMRVVSCAVSDCHALCVTDAGIIYSWGRQGQTGCLGRPDVAPTEAAVPGVVLLPKAARLVDCESGVSAAVLLDGSLLVWGSNEFGRLGLGQASLKKAFATPTPVILPEGSGAVTALSLGSLYSACICLSEDDHCKGPASHSHALAESEGHHAMEVDQGHGGSILLTWGYGGHGNLGHGDRHDRHSPTRVTGVAESAFTGEARLLAVACTRGQEGVK